MYKFFSSNHVFLFYAKVKFLYHVISYAASMATEKNHQITQTGSSHFTDIDISHTILIENYTTVRQIIIDPTTFLGSMARLVFKLPLIKFLK